jgi:hypothetical protein
MRISRIELKSTLTIFASSTDFLISEESDDVFAAFKEKGEYVVC